jgi:hypothetical protein
LLSIISFSKLPHYHTGPPTTTPAMTRQLSENDLNELNQHIRVTEGTFHMLISVSAGMPELKRLAISAGEEHRRLLRLLLAHRRSKVARKDVNNDPCPICYEAMDADGGDVTYCWEKCGNNVHTACMRKWVATHVDDTVTCSLCRTKWHKGHLPPLKIQRGTCCGMCTCLNSPCAASVEYVRKATAKKMHAHTIQTAWRNYKLRDNAKMKDAYDNMYAYIIQSAWREYMLHRG